MSFMQEGLHSTQHQKLSRKRLFIGCKNFKAFLPFYVYSLIGAAEESEHLKKETHYNES